MFCKRQQAPAHVARNWAQLVDALMGVSNVISPGGLLAQLPEAQTVEGLGLLPPSA